MQGYLHIICRKTLYWNFTNELHEHGFSVKCTSERNLIEHAHNLLSDKLHEQTSGSVHTAYQPLGNQAVPLYLPDIKF